MARLLLAALLATALPALAGEDQDAPYPVEVKAGQAFPICSTGTIICPATVPICDDVGVATMRDGARGMEIVGVKPGQTLCSAQSANQLRRVYRVTVR